jgi:hypothetical protein
MVLVFGRLKATDHRRRNVGVAAERRLVIVAGVALKQHLAVSCRTHTRDQITPIGTGDLHKRRHIVQAEYAPVVAERAGDGSVVTQGEYAASLAARTVDG